MLTSIWLSTYLFSPWLSWFSFSLDNFGIFANFSNQRNLSIERIICTDTQAWMVFDNIFRSWIVLDPRRKLVCFSNQSNFLTRPFCSTDFNTHFCLLSISLYSKIHTQFLTVFTFWLPEVFTFSVYRMIWFSNIGCIFLTHTSFYCLFEIYIQSSQCLF